VDDDGEVSGPGLKVYWRPGCPYCFRMRRALRRAGVEADWVDIWSDDEARAQLRAFADGNETVPTVVLGSEVLVAPSPGSVLRRLGVARRRRFFRY